MPVLASRFHATEPRGQKGAGYKRMAGNYVYYNRLFEEDSPSLVELGQSAVASLAAQLKALSAATIPTSNAISNLKLMATEELRKEEQMLREMFGANINVNLQDPNQIKLLINTLNEALSIKAAYERLRALIVDTKGQKNIFTWFGDYFFKQWNSPENTKFLREGIGNALRNQMSVPVQISLMPIMEQSIDNCIQGAIAFMTTEANAENGIDKSYKNAYVEFLDLLQRYPLIYNTFAARLKAIFHFDELQGILMERINKNSSRYKTQISKDFVKQIHIKGGLVMEARIQAMTLGVLEDTFSKAGIAVSGANIGGKGGKVDNYFTIGITGAVSSTIEEGIASTPITNREDAIALFSEIGNLIKGLTNGYIIYDSDKNQTMNKGFYERGGFKAGDDINISKLESILALAGASKASANTVGGIALQAGAGAIGDKMNIHETVERYVALNIAAFLFDDFNTIGEYNTGGNAIHVMNLNGVYVPLSTLLFKLAEAAEAVQSDIDSYVHVRLQAPPIIYPNPGTGIGMACWIEQRRSALANTKISIHFLRNLKEMLS